MSGGKYYIAISIQYTAECSQAAAATAAALFLLSVLFFSTKMNVATIMSRICMP